MTDLPNGEDRIVYLSVLVPVLDEQAHIARVAAAMQAQRFEGELEFLFIDGGSQDATRGILEVLARADSRIRILDNPARQIPQALNIGLEAARGRYIARMDGHTVYRSSYLAAGVERLERGGVEWVSGPQLARGDDRWSRRVELALGTRLGVGGARFRRALESELEVDAGFTGVWRKGTLDALGGWDVGWPVNEDGELAARIRKAGGRIVCLPAMEGHYAPRNSLKALAVQYWRYGQYRAKTSGRHPESMRLSHLLPPLAAVTALASPLPIGAVGRTARAGLAAYCVCLVGVTGAAARRARPSDIAAMPAVLLTMHLAWGFGFIVGAARFGIPVAAVGRVMLGVARRVWARVATSCRDGARGSGQ
jgi:succinoglycan biosynthesis protein ExoA